MAMDRRRTRSGYVPLRDALDQLFETSFIGPQSYGAGQGFPPADMYTTDDDVVLEMAIPGASPDDIDISVMGDSVTVTGEVRGHGHAREGRQAYLDEIWQGKFQRSFTLPTQVDPNAARAEFTNGILVLTLPKSEATKPRKIQVQRAQVHDQSK